MTDSQTALHQNGIGNQMYDLIAELFPICRSITGEGFRQTIKILQRHIPLKTHEVPTGTRVFDWTIPREWNIRDAYVKNAEGEKVIDFQMSNLHILNYSIPVNKTIPFEELKEHLYTLPNHPEWIPYKTSYYHDNWGFCLSHKRFLEMNEGAYEVFIDSTLKDGSLTYGELYLEGESADEILISCHACHPSLANDNLSGISLAAYLAKRMSGQSHRYSYRFLFIPGTIGAIAWLAMNEAKTSNIKHGLVLSGVGDKGNITYKKSRQGNAEIDKVALHVLQASQRTHDILEFTPYGYDERQYCSPGFNLAVGCLSRSQYAQYPEYHTSADNMEFVQPQYLEESFAAALSMVEVLEGNAVYVNRMPKCEPQLGKRGLYGSAGINEMAMLWVLNMSDGTNSLLDIAEMSGLRLDQVCKAGKTLQSHGLLDQRSS